MDTSSNSRMRVFELVLQDNRIHLHLFLLSLCRYDSCHTVNTPVDKVKWLLPRLIPFELNDVPK